MTEHLIPDGSITYLVVKPAVHGFRADYPHLAVVRT